MNFCCAHTCSQPYEISIKLTLEKYYPDRVDKDVRIFLYVYMCSFPYICTWIEISSLYVYIYICIEHKFEVCACANVLITAHSLQHTATHCNTLQNIHAHSECCNTLCVYVSRYHCYMYIHMYMCITYVSHII